MPIAIHETIAASVQSIASQAVAAAKTGGSIQRGGFLREAATSQAGNARLPSVLDDVLANQLPHDL